MSDSERAATRREFLEMSAAALAGLTVSSANASLATAALKTAGLEGERADWQLPSLTITEAAKLIAAKQLSPVELVRATLDRIETLNPKIGAFITVAADQAMEAARIAETEIMQGRYRGTLHGIPFGAKDTNYSTGVRTTAGSFVLRDFYPDYDAAVIRRLKEAGAILVGKTNLPEFSFGGTTPGCYNPWDITRNGGGSSGGSGAALAASMVPAATGGDTSGSIRNPASTNGAVGHKPTFGLVSRHGVVPISWTLDHLGPMANTVEDVAILLTAMAGPDPDDAFSAGVAAENYPQLLRQDIKDLQIGFLAESEMKNFHPDTRRAFLQAVRVLEAQGAHVREVVFSEQAKRASAAHMIIRISEAATYHRQYLRTHEHEYRHIWDSASEDRSRTRTTVEAGLLLTASQYLRAQQARKVFLREVHKVYDSLDVYLDPTMPSPAGEPAEGAEAYRNWLNLSGFPAVSIPCGFSSNPPGLPIGLQISSKPFQDSLVLAVAHAYESATDWHRRRAPV